METNGSEQANVIPVSDYINNRSKLKPKELLHLKSFILSCLDKSHVSKDNPFLLKPPQLVVDLYTEYTIALGMIEDDLISLVSKHNRTIK